MDSDVMKLFVEMAITTIRVVLVAALVMGTLMGTLIGGCVASG
jgi:hypothetical protein